MKNIILLLMLLVRYSFAENAQTKGYRILSSTNNIYRINSEKGVCKKMATKYVRELMERGLCINSISK